MTEKIESLDCSGIDSGNSACWPQWINIGWNLFTTQKNTSYITSFEKYFFNLIKYFRFICSIKKKFNRFFVFIVFQNTM